MDRNTNTVSVVHDGTAVSVTKFLIQIRIEYFLFCCDVELYEIDKLFPFDKI